MSSTVQEVHRYKFTHPKMGEPRPDHDYASSVGEQLLDFHTWIRLRPPALMPEDAVLQPGYELPIGDAAFVSADRSVIANYVSSIVHRIANSLKQPAHR